MSRNRALEELWATAAPTDATFDPGSIEPLPAAARRYLGHALAPGATLSTCARLRMSGTIRLGPGWCPFDAEQVIRWDRGFVWAARARVRGLSVRGFDRLVDGEAAMRWKLLGLVPVLRADGPDITRSALGRMHAEAMWLPTALLRPEVRWADGDAGHALATVETHGQRSELDLAIDPTGALRSCRLERWGDAGGEGFGYQPFGAVVEEEGSFQGITIPVRLRVGWHFGSDRFASEGEFFRCTIEAVEYR